MRLLTTKELCELTGTPAGTIDRLRGSGHLNPEIDGGRGYPGDLWSPMQALALIVSRGLRKRGVSVAQAGAILNLFWAMTPAELENNFAHGHCAIMAVGDLATPLLLNMASILETAKAHETDLRNVGITTTALDVERIWRMLLDEIQGLSPRRNHNQQAKA